MPLTETVLKAASAAHIPEGMAGLWYIVHRHLAHDIVSPRLKANKSPVKVPAGDYCQLWRYTEATLHEFGELVMTDMPFELNTHLEFMMRARGRVLITGLGLGCVARGCLANPAVDNITIIERDRDVLKLVQPYMPRERCKIIQADAVEWCREHLKEGQFDTAWHDLWNDSDKEEPHLALIHSSLLVACHGKVDLQGAWAFPRDQKRAWKRMPGFM